MIQKTLKVSAGVVIAAFFLWLALRNIEFREVLSHMQGISYWWIIPYTVVSLFSHFIRGERWRLLVKRTHNSPQRDTLFTGVMIGYFVNYAIPRLGEISRSVYVARKTDMSSSDVIGTVVLERIVDFICMMIMLSVVVFVIITDLETMQRVFGERLFSYLAWLAETRQIIAGLILAVTGLVVALLVYGLFRYWKNHSEIGQKVAVHLAGILKQFWVGLTAITRMRNWPLFLFTTALIWISYALMAYIPFMAFGLTSEYGLGFFHAWVVMIISAVGVALPSPGGVGTYHWFVTQSLVALFGVPLAVSLAYAFVTHAIMMVIILFFTPLIIMINSGGKLNFSFLRRSL